MATPTRDQIERDTITILKQVANRPIEPSPKSEVVGDLGFDSVQVLELVSELEDHFNINIPINSLSQIKTVAQMVDQIKLLADKQAEAR